MHLPHLLSFRSSAVVFLTTCVHQRHSLLACEQAHEVLHDIWIKSAGLNGWYVGQYLLMPDHVHLFACQAPDARPLASWMRLLKSISATQINRSLVRRGRSGRWITLIGSSDRIATTRRNGTTSH